MIGIIFEYGGEIVETRVLDKEVFFRTSTFGSQFVSIDGLYYNKDKVISEFPELKNDEMWREKAIQKLREKIKNMKTESEIADYLIEDLSKHGYVPKYKQRAGFRVERIK